MEIWEHILLLEVWPSSLPRWPWGSHQQLAHLTLPSTWIQPKAGTSWPGPPHQPKGFCAQLGATPQQKAVEEASVPPSLPLSLAKGRDRALGCSYCSIPLCITPAAPQSLGSSQKCPIESESNCNVLHSTWLLFLLNCWICGRGFLWVCLLLCFRLFGFCFDYVLHWVSLLIGRHIIKPKSVSGVNNYLLLPSSSALFQFCFAFLC